MSPVWVNGKMLDTSQPKAEKWSPIPRQDKVLWGLCKCGEVIYEGDSVGMKGDHQCVVCYTCWMTGEFPDTHADCAGLKLPDATLSQ